jgi:hypothetical protein
MDKPNFDTICLSGGGMKGFSFFGAIDYLESNSYINTLLINNWVGTSIGSMIAFLYTLGYTTDDMRDFILEFNFNKLQSDIDVNNLLESHGIDNGSKLLLILAGFLKQKYNLDDITFEEHYKLTNKKLTIIGTNFSKGLEVPFNYKLTPSMSVLMALRISTAVPIIFTPVLYNSDYYIDGALSNNFPIKYCNPESTLGIYVKNSCCNKLTNFFTLIGGCVAIITDTISQKDYFNKYNYIVEINNVAQDLINFNLDRDNKIKIINLGHIYAKKFLENINNYKSHSYYTNQSTQTDEPIKIGIHQEIQTDDIIPNQENK